MTLHQHLLRAGILSSLLLVPGSMTAAAAASPADVVDDSLQYRPAIHFSPEENFMNDPNGVLYDESSDTYHLYYQYNPSAAIAGNQHWGHATSQDLYHWEDKPIALYPTKEGGLAFSGSMVNDVNNTSGLFASEGDSNLVAIYTQAFPDHQVQAIAYSTDGGISFTQYEGNPVLDLNESQYRDPQVQWYEPQQKWVQTTALSREHKILFYESKDLIHWNQTGEFSAGIFGVDYECPNLVPVRNEETGDFDWVLFVSINPGTPIGGSGTQYFIGDFDGYQFTVTDNSTNLIDIAKDNYALQVVNRGNQENHVDDATYIGWFSNWQYCQTVPTEKWRSSMTLPRQISIKKNWLNEDRLVQKPRGLEALRKDCSTTFPFEFNTGFDGTNVTREDQFSTAAQLPNSTTAIEIDLQGEFGAKADNATPGTFRFTVDLYNDNDESVQLGIDVLTSQLWLDRSKLKGFTDPFYTGQFSQAIDSPTKDFDWKIVFDGSLLELFANEGFVVASSVIFPEQPLTNLRVSLPRGGSVKGNVTVYPLEKTMNRITLNE